VPQPVNAHVLLPGLTASVPTARNFEAAVLVVSELATNAVLHARSGFTVVLQLEASGSLRIEVLDGSARLPLHRTATPGAATGRGLAIVQGLVSAWGAEPLDKGKRVWVQLDHPTSSSREAFGASRGGGRGHPRVSAPSGPEASAA
jgi:hypothetical protein